jgi:DNA-directed RNA polymerase subunit K/omega
MSKPIKTLYVNKKNINIKNIEQLGGKNNDETEEEDNEEIESEEDNEEDNEEEDNEEEDNEEVNEEIDDTDEIDNEDEEIGDDINDNIESDTELVEDNDENNDTIDDKKSSNSNVKKCYQKYAFIADNDLDLDEYFTDDPNKILKSSRLTKPFLTKYEKVRLISVRSKQLAQGAKPLIKNISGLSATEIAMLELKNKVIPLIIERPVPNVGIERWKLSELEIL